MSTRASGATMRRREFITLLTPGAKVGIKRTRLKKRLGSNPTPPPNVVEKKQFSAEQKFQPPE